MWLENTQIWLKLKIKNKCSKYDWNKRSKQQEKTYVKEKYKKTQNISKIKNKIIFIVLLILLIVCVFLNFWT